MSESQIEPLEELFAAALARDPEERQVFLEKTCNDNTSLRHELAELLSASEAATGYFESLTSDIAAAAPLELDSAAQPKVQIGPYRTIQVIGHGGMGAVYRAMRVDGGFDQQVALKLLHLDMQTPEIRARFLAERQLLARLSHPHIAHLQDGGVTDEGRPYFVMEFIDGQPITRYCEEHKLSVAATLKLFLDVIDAASYLHRNLVVHRDLKPSNIFVDTAGHVKLLDFGIAKLLAKEVTGSDRTLTREQLLTPEYAAPEQLVGDPVTTATDVYALGVVLYELLAGRRPFERSSTGLRSQHESAPATPSAALQSGYEGSAFGRTPRPRAAWRQIAGDLDNICLMALRPEPDRRYPSAEQLGQDIERHLLGMTVRARKSTLRYRLTKFAQRRPREIAAAAILAGVVAVGFVRERDLRGNAELARAAAQDEAAKAVAVSDFLAEVLSSADPAKAQGQDLTIDEVLEQAAQRLEGDHVLQGQAAVEAMVRLTIGNTYTALDKPAQAKPHLKRALALRRDMKDADLDTLKAAEALGEAHLRASEHEEAEALFSRVLERRTKILGEEHPDTLTTMNNLANLYWHQERFDDVEPLDRRIVEIRRRILGKDHPDTLKSLNGLAVTLFSGARYQEAAEILRDVATAQQRLLGPNHPATLQAGNNLAACYTELGRYRDSVPLLRDILDARLRVQGETHEDTIESLHNLGYALAGQGEYEMAEALLRRAIAGRENDSRTFAISRRLESMNILASVYRELNRLEEAESLFLTTLEQQRKLRGEEDEYTLWTARGLAELRLRQGQVQTAEQMIEPILEAQTRILGAHTPNTLQSMITLSRIRNTQQRFDEALALANEIVEVGTRSLGAEHPFLLEAKVETLIGLRGKGRLVQARALATEIHTSRSRILGNEHPHTAEALQLVRELATSAGDSAP